MILVKIMKKQKIKEAQLYKLLDIKFALESANMHIKYILENLDELEELKNLYKNLK